MTKKKQLSAQHDENFATLINRALTTKIRVTTERGVRWMMVQDIMILKLANRASKGDKEALRALLKLKKNYVELGDLQPLTIIFDREAAQVL